MILPSEASSMVGEWVGGDEYGEGEEKWGKNNFPKKSVYEISEVIYGKYLSGDCFCTNSPLTH